MVERYGSLCGNDDYQEMAEADDGAWVKYSDYEALEAEVARLRKLLERWDGAFHSVVGYDLRIKTRAELDGSDG